MESRARLCSPLQLNAGGSAVTDERDDVHLLRLYFTYRIQQTLMGSLVGLSLGLLLGALVIVSAWC